MIRMTVALSLHMLTLMTLLAFALSPTGEEAQKSACGSGIRAIEINKATLHYFECGEGEPIVFVHGSLGDLHTFQRQVQTFAKSFRVIAYSRRFFPPNALPRTQDVNPQHAHVADLLLPYEWPQESNRTTLSNSPTEQDQNARQHSEDCCQG